jgi:hypothetical protein
MQGFFECLELAFVVRWFDFLSFWPPLLWGAIIFSIFLMTFNMSNVPIRGVQVFFDTKKNGAFPLDLACLEHLSVIVATQL